MIVYKLNAKGKMCSYEIFPFEDGYMVIWGQLGGAFQQKLHRVETNQSGRLHIQQAKLEINSKLTKLRDQGYKDTIEEARKGDTNAMGLIRPMLAKKYEDQPTADMLTQYKYDGHRCLIHNDNGTLIAYSRRGKRIETIPHILEGLKVPEGCTVDGELYIHGVPLQTLSSYIKKAQRDSERLQYMMYDIDTMLSYPERLRTLQNMRKNENVTVAPTWKSESIKKDLEGALADGYEGLILRGGVGGYEAGKRSKSLLKVKAWLDQNFTIIDIDESVDGHAILVFENFSATAPGTHEEKIEIANDPDLYIGMEARVEYSKLTRDGVPFHPVVTDIVDL